MKKNDLHDADHCHVRCGTYFIRSHFNDSRLDRLYTLFSNFMIQNFVQSSRSDPANPSMNL